MYKELQPDNDTEWLKLRTTVLTASDMGIVLGLNKYESVANMVKKKENPEPFSNAYTWIGQALEPVVVMATNEVLGSEFKLFEDDGIRRFFISTEQRMGATPDAHDGVTLLECKTTGHHNYIKWANWPPAYYLSQLYTQMICTGKDIGHLGVLSTNLTQKNANLSLPIHVHRLTRDDRIDIIFNKEVKRFWECYDSGKQYRVDRKQSVIVEMLLRFNLEKIYDK